MRWGPIPAWWKKAIRDMPATFNARAETVAEKPMFRTAFRRSRCIVPASGYYEWKTINGAKQPFYFSAADDGVLSIAGLWDEWKDRSSPAGPLFSCTLIVTAANEFAGRIHDRMPVFLQPEKFAALLDGSAGTELLKLASKDLLRCSCAPQQECSADVADGSSAYWRGICRELDFYSKAVFCVGTQF